MSTPTPPRISITDDLASVAGPLLAQLIESTLSRQPRCRLALSGGGTPGSTLTWLGEHLPAAVYPKLAITLVDERAVPANHPDANIGLAEDAWLSHAPARPGLILPMIAGDGQDLHGERARFEAAFDAQFGGGIDIALLGVGPDGHIGSLFPDHPGLDVVAQRCIAVEDSPKPPPRRLSLSLPVLQAAPAVVLLARGASKAPVLARALNHDPEIPLGRVNAHGIVHWVVDPAAAAGLPETAS